MKILICFAFFSAFMFSANARDNSLDGTVLLYLPGLGNTPKEYDIRLRRIDRFKSAMLGIDDEIIVDGVHTGLIWEGIELEDKFVSVQFYLEQLVPQSLSAILYHKTIASIIIDKKLPTGDLPFNSEINNFLQELLLDTLTLTPQNSDLENILKKTEPYLTSKKRVINIGYSQGSLYDNIAYTSLKSSNTFKNKLECQYGSFHQGSGVPSIFNPMNNYVVVENDFLSLKFDEFGLPHLAPNYKIPNPQLIVIKNVFHGFLEVYWNPEVMARKLSGGDELSMTAITMKSLEGLADKMDKKCGVPPVAIFSAKSRASIQPNPNPMIWDFDGSKSKDDDTRLIDPDAPQTPEPEVPDFDIDPNGFEWLIDGKDKYTGMKPIVTFAKEGDHTVQLIVTDLAGNKSKPEIKTVNVINQAPVANFSFAVNKLKVTFNASNSIDPDGTIKSYFWSFGDGHFSSGSTPTHTYLLPGFFNVTLTVTDNNGKTGTFQTQVEAKADGLMGCKDLGGISHAGKRHRNPDGSEGGFVQDGATVTPSVLLGYNVEVCNGATVTDTAQILSNSFGNIPTIKITDGARVTGNSTIGRFFSSEAIVIGASSIINNSTVNGTSTLLDSKIINTNVSESNLNRVTVENSLSVSIDASTLLRVTIRGSSVSVVISTLTDVNMIGDQNHISDSIVTRTDITSSFINAKSKITDSVLQFQRCSEVNLTGATSCPN